MLFGFIFPPGVGEELSETGGVGVVSAEGFSAANAVDALAEVFLAVAFFLDAPSLLLLT